MQDTEQIKQYRLMMTVFDKLAMRIWRGNENKQLNKLLDDFIFEHSKPNTGASPSPQGASQYPSIIEEERGHIPPQRPD